MKKVGYYCPILKFRRLKHDQRVLWKLTIETKTGISRHVEVAHAHQVRTHPITNFQNTP